MILAQVVSVRDLTTSTNDNKYTGRSQSVRTPENIHKMKDFLADDQRRTGASVAKHFLGNRKITGWLKVKVHV